jgi:hypothetical protein
MEKVYLAAAFALALTGCASNSNSGSQAQETIYNDPSVELSGSGVGIESQDIVAVTEKMASDILASPQVSAREITPRIIVDSEYFTNESSSRTLNKNLLTDRLRVGLTKAAAGKLVFVGREHVAMVEKERELKRAGVTDAGTIRITQATAGADYRLVGRISSLDSVKTGNQMASRYHQIVFELIDLELGTIVWNNVYEFKKTAKDDVVYY